MKIRATSVVKLKTANVNMDFTFPRECSAINVITEIARMACIDDPDDIERLEALIVDIKADKAKRDAATSN